MALKKIVATVFVILFVAVLNPMDVRAQAMPQQKRVALIANYYAISSHANALATKFFVGFPTDEGMIPSQIKIVSVWIDQPSPDSSGKKGVADVGRKIAKKNGAKIYPTIAEALTLGGDKLAVDAVIYIGEHGEYPRSRLGVKMYPRLNFLEQIFRVFDASNKVVPVYTDKALAYSWLDAKWIYDRSKELNVPLMAGSVLPYSWRDPILQHPVGTKITEAVAVGYGALDSYGFHVAEILECMLERRKGGETGVASVQGLKGPAVWKAADEGKFSMKLVEEACNRIKGKSNGSMREVVKEPIAILVNYKDGTKGAILMLSGYVGEGWGYAATAGGKTTGCEFVLESTTNAHFSYLGLNIQNFFQTGKAPAPLERTLLTGGILDTGIRSIAEGGKLTETPFLNMHYSVEGYTPIIPSHSRPLGQSVGPWPPAGYEFIVPQPATTK
ncbi:MAG TPA: hypothetical protein VF487_09665 [Chitinophagaceae bacterium]